MVTEECAAHAALESRAFATALGRNARHTLPHMDWDELAPHIELAWKSSSVSSGMSWDLAREAAHMGWIESGECDEQREFHVP